MHLIINELLAKANNDNNNQQNTNNIFPANHIQNHQIQNNATSRTIRNNILHQNHLISSAQNVSMLSTNSIPMIPLSTNLSFNTLSSSMPLNAQNNVNHEQESMISVKLSFLNNLMQKVKLYETLFVQLLSQSPNLHVANHPNATNLISTTSNNNNPHQHQHQHQQQQSNICNDSPQNIFHSKSPQMDSAQTHKRKAASETKQTNNMNTREFNKNIGNNYVQHHTESETGANKKKKAAPKKDDNDYYVCRTCGKRYRYICNLRSHSKVHTDAAHICEFCNKRFGRKANCEEHKRIHTGELPYKCDVCNKKFRQRHGWKDHIKMHEKEKANARISEN